MCITSAAARLSRTKILSCTIGEKHLLAYANSATNLSNQPNCMILPVPGTLTKEDFIDSTPYAGFLSALEEAWTPRSRSLGYGSKGVLRSMEPPVEQFKVGMYEVFLAPGFPPTGAMSGKTTIAERIIGKKHRINEALSRLPEERRPAIREDLLEWFDRTYPGWSLVCCVFESTKPMDSQPIMFTYTPFESFKGKLFFPAVDSHSGGPPDLNEHVHVDHFLFAEHTDGHPIGTSTRGYTVPQFLADKKVFGVKYQHQETNGDWIHDMNMTKVSERVHVTVRPGVFKRTKPET